MKKQTNKQMKTVEVNTRGKSLCASKHVQKSSPTSTIIKLLFPLFFNHTRYPLDQSHVRPPFTSLSVALLFCSRNINEYGEKYCATKQNRDEYVKMYFEESKITHNV